jgi:hypothetical protein
MARKKIKLEEEAISEILVADTNCKSGAEASDSEEYFEEEEEEEDDDDDIIIIIVIVIVINNNKPQQNSKQDAASGRLPNWGFPQGRNTNINPFVGPAKGVKSVAPHINKDSLPLSLLMFFTEICHLLVEQANVYYQ